MRELTPTSRAPHTSPTALTATFVGDQEGEEKTVGERTAWLGREEGGWRENSAVGERGEAVGEREQRGEESRGLDQIESVGPKKRAASSVSKHSAHSNTSVRQTRC